MVALAGVASTTPPPKTRRLVGRRGSEQARGDDDAGEWRLQLRQMAGLPEICQRARGSVTHQIDRFNIGWRQKRAAGGAATLSVALHPINKLQVASCQLLVASCQSGHVRRSAPLAGGASSTSASLKPRPQSKSKHGSRPRPRTRTRRRDAHSAPLLPSLCAQAHTPCANGRAAAGPWLLSPCPFSGDVHPQGVPQGPSPHPSSSNPRHHLRLHLPTASPTLIARLRHACSPSPHRPRPLSSPPLSLTLVVRRGCSSLSPSTLPPAMAQQPYEHPHEASAPLPTPPSPLTPL